MTDNRTVTLTARLASLLRRIVVVSALGLALYLVLNFSQFLGGQFETPSNGQPLSPRTLTGFHCAGMCGALVVGYTVRAASEGGTKYLTHLYYGAGKTLSYTVIGGLFGALGSIVTFTPFMRGVAGLAAGVFLVLFGLSTLRVFAPLGRFQIKTPGFIMRWVGKALRRNTNPFVIGLLNGLMIICGPLQAMYIMAAGTGNPIEGAKMLFVFGLGTLPLMMGFGFLASALSRQFAPKLVRASGVIVVALGIIMLQRGHAMIGGVDPHAAMGHADHAAAGAAGGAPAPQSIHTMVERTGPVADQPVVRVGTPVQWMLMGESLADCGGRVSMEALQQTWELTPGMSTFAFTPTEPGLLHWHPVRPAASKAIFGSRQRQSGYPRFPWRQKSGNSSRKAPAPWRPCVASCTHDVREAEWRGSGSTPNRS